MLTTLVMPKPVDNRDLTLASIVTPLRGFVQNSRSPISTLALHLIHLAKPSSRQRHQAFAIMGSTADRVLNTPEILEQIFLKADMRTLLCIQRVCRTWHKLITESPSVQKHLFLRPDPDCEIPQINPLLHELFPQWFHRPEGDRQKLIQRDGFSSLPLVQHSCNSAFRHEKASWRRMLPRQPPVQSLTCCTHVSGQMGDSVDLSSISQQSPNESAKSLNEDDKRKAFPSQPIEMETLYTLVTSGIGDVSEWLFIWDGLTSHNLVFPELGYRELDASVKEILTKELKRTGVIIFRSSVMQCTGRGPWGFGEEYKLHMARHNKQEEKLLPRQVRRRGMEGEEVG